MKLLNKKFKPVLTTLIEKFSQPYLCGFNTSSCLQNEAKLSEDSKISETAKELARRVEATKQVTKEDMQWQKPWAEREKSYYMALRVFYTDKTNVELVKLLSSPIDLSISSIKKWLANRRKEKQIVMQSYIAERVEILGCELAAAHFIVFRGGAIKFFGEDKWIKADNNGNYELPNRYNSDKVLEAIDCSEMDLHYEGFSVLKNLRQVQWLSLNNCRYVDDWCLDTISNIFSHSLIYLDLRNCPNITYRGIGALHQIKSLKILFLDSMYKGEEYEMTNLLLQELLPELDIKLEDD